MPTAHPESRNFLELPHSLFSERVFHYARNRQLNAEPLLRQLERAACITRGLRAVLMLVRNNAVQELMNEDIDPDEPIDPALRRHTVESLLELGEEAAAMLAEDIEGTARWAEQYGGLPSVRSMEEKPGDRP